MISATNVYIQYGDRVLMDNINVVIGTRDRVGLVGRNGAGKSTLLKLIAGVEQPQQGQISRPSNSTLGFLHQDMSIPKGKTVMEETLSAFDNVRAMEQRIEEINEELGSRTDYESDEYTNLIIELSDLTERFQIMGGSTMVADTERILKGLGFKATDVNRLTDEFSGGWQMRVELAKMLLQRPDYLLLDEPTNHLDIESIIWLENFLQDYPGAVIVISHDKQFLDHVTNRTIEIELGNVYDYKASYSKYVEQRVERRELMQNAYENQQKVIAQKERTIARFIAKANKTTMAQSMQKQLDKMERIEISEEDITTMNIRFPPAPRAGQVVVDAKAISKSYGNLHVLEHVDLKLDRGDRVAFVGQNGQGKTTLAKILLGLESHNKGEVILGHNVQVGYYAQNQADILQGNFTLLEIMEQNSPPEMRTKLRAILGAFMFSGEDAGKKASVLSGGERARLALACMLLKPFNLLLLDEPTNHLDMLSKSVLKQALMEYDGTLIVVSHDRDFLEGLANRTIEFRDRQLKEYLGDINYFLEKRALDNMRDVEMQSAKPAATELKNTNIAERELTFDEKKELEKDRRKYEREIQQLEQKIEQIESKIEVIEVKMAEPDFYNRPDSAKIMDQYKQLKAELNTVVAQWEEAVEKIS